MTGGFQHALIDWHAEGVPVARHFDDPYFSLQGGLAETEHVFLAGNGLPARFCPGFHIAELGFGTGLNMLAALRAWRDSGQTTALQYTGFEAFPMSIDDTRRALAAFPAALALADPVFDQWESGEIRTTGLVARIIYGDARLTLPAWDGRADAWFLDGFSPAKNPELWTADLMQAVGAHTRQGGTCASYTAAGHVRRALGAAGFDVARRPGFGRKRHMTSGVLR